MIGYKVLLRDMKAPVAKVTYNKEFQYSFNQRYHIREDELEFGECGFHFLSSLYEAIWYKYMLQKTYLTRFSKSIDLAIYEIDTLDGEIVTDDIIRAGSTISMKASSVIYINRELTTEEIDNSFKTLNFYNNGFTYTTPFKHYKYKSPLSKEDVNPVGGSAQIPAIRSCEIIIESKPEYKECIDKIDITVVKDRLKIVQEYV